jgi:tetratricopeptide (TPR) repeat protein
MVRRCLLLGCLACLGCHTLAGAPPVDSDPAAAADKLWEQGQEAMRRGQPERAIDLYERSLSIDAGKARNHMSLAAAYLEAGDEPGACSHLARYVAAHPEQLRVRANYAELLWRLRRLAEAQVEFERFLADAQDEDDDLRPLIHGHSRLMEIAESRNDAYECHLHKGIGLLLLSRRLEGVDNPPDELSREGLLCKAAGELALAQALAPEEARPCWYLHVVWAHLAQKHQAMRWLWAAEKSAPFSYLTSAEHRSLEFACRLRAATAR